MELRIAYHFEQEYVDTIRLQEEVAAEAKWLVDFPSLVRIFFDTIDDEVPEEKRLRHFIKKGYEYIILRVPRGEYDAQPDKQAFAKRRVLEALQSLAVVA